MDKSKHWSERWSDPIRVWFLWPLCSLKASFKRAGVQHWCTNDTTWIHLSCAVIQGKSPLEANVTTTQRMRELHSTFWNSNLLLTTTNVRVESKHSNVCRVKAAKDSCHSAECRCRSCWVHHFFSELYSNLSTDNLATNLWFGKSSCPAPFKSGGRAVRQIYTGNIWEKSGFRKKTKKGSAGLRLNHRLQAGPKLRGLQEPQHEYTQHTPHLHPAGALINQL